MAVQSSCLACVHYQLYRLDRNCSMPPLSRLIAAILLTFLRGPDLPLIIPVTFCCNLQSHHIPPLGWRSRANWNDGLCVCHLLCVHGSGSCGSWEVWHGGPRQLLQLATRMEFLPAPLCTLPGSRKSPNSRIPLSCFSPFSSCHRPHYLTPEQTPWPIIWTWSIAPPPQVHHHQDPCQKT